MRKLVADVTLDGSPCPPIADGADSVHLHIKTRAQVPESIWPVLSRQVECAVQHWTAPDRGRREV